jgi:hypothetical protein
MKGTSTRKARLREYFAGDVAEFQGSNLQDAGGIAFGEFARSELPYRG